MIYVWACKDTGKLVEVERSMENYEIKPTWAECKSQGWTSEDYDKVNMWIRLVTGGSFTKGFGNKGQW